MDPERQTTSSVKPGNKWPETGTDVLCVSIGHDDSIAHYPEFGSCEGGVTGGGVLTVPQNKYALVLDNLIIKCYYKSCDIRTSYSYRATV